MRFSVESVIYLYIFICVALLMFNILYIFRAKWIERRREKRVLSWRSRIARNPLLSERDVKQLKKIDQLTAFGAALTETRSDPTAWFQENIQAVQQLAVAYGKRPAMERAFVAYWIAGFRTPVPAGQAMLPQILLQYLDRSTVFSRENTLRALYALGNAGMIEHAFQVINDRQYYHNPKLISDGMRGFAGNSDELVARLWRHRGEWEDCLLVGVVQYAAMLEGFAWNEAFLQALSDRGTSLEVRFALIRYFQRHTFDQAFSELRSLARTDDPMESDLKVAAVSALAAYKGEEVHTLLLDSLRDANWYVRRNAAQALIKRGITETDRTSVRETGDRYAMEMLEYMAHEETESRKR